MRRPILWLLVIVCAALAQGHPIQAQSNRGQAGGTVYRKPRAGHGQGRHTTVPPSISQGHAHSHGHAHQGSSAGSGVTVWRRPARQRMVPHDHGFEFGAGLPFFFDGFGSSGFGYGPFDYGPGPGLYGGYYFGPEGFLPPPAYGPPPPFPMPDPWLEPNPFAVPIDPLLPGDPGWNHPWAVEPAAEPAPQPVAESTPAARLKSIRAQARGDLWFRRQQYHHARDRYKTAVQDAGDRPEARVRLALTHAALGSYGSAVRELKIALQLNPALPSVGESLDDLFGPDNQMAKLSLISRVSAWVRQDLRDPDRLFLLGALLYFNGDAEKAMPLLEAARRFGGPAEHVQAFLDPVEPVEPDTAAHEPAADPPQTDRDDPIDFLVPPLPDPPGEDQPNAPPAAAEERSPSGPVLPPLPNP